MDTENGQNGHGNGQVYVKFGPRPTQEIPIEWAEKILTMLKNDHESQFGKLLTKAAISQ